MSRAILDDFYVNDLLIGCETIDQAIRLRDTITTILAQACLPVRKWARVTWWAHDHSESHSRVEFKEADKDTKTLGLLWHVDVNILSLTIKDCQFSRITKRPILSRYLLELIAPVIIKSKLIMQNLWQSSVG
jgi:hypothetical protein